MARRYDSGTTGGLGASGTLHHTNSSARLLSETSAAKGTLLLGPQEGRSNLPLMRLTAQLFMVCSSRCFIGVSHVYLRETWLYFNSRGAESAGWGARPRLCRFILLSATRMLALIFCHLHLPSPLLRNSKCTFKESSSPTFVPPCLQLTWYGFNLKFLD